MEGFWEFMELRQTNKILEEWKNYELIILL